LELNLNLVMNPQPNLGLNLNSKNVRKRNQEKKDKRERKGKMAHGPKLPELGPVRPISRARLGSCLTDGPGLPVSTSYARFRRSVRDRWDQAVRSIALTATEFTQRPPKSPVNSPPVQVSR
jgi:hypothetical protein